MSINGGENCLLRRIPAELLNIITCKLHGVDLCSLYATCSWLKLRLEFVHVVTEFRGTIPYHAQYKLDFVVQKLCHRFKFLRSIKLKDNFNLGRQFTGRMLQMLPSTLLTLDLGPYLSLNENVDGDFGLFPHNLTYLRLYSTTTAQDIGRLPRTLRYLKLIDSCLKDDMFRQLPHTLLTLKLGNCPHVNLECPLEHFPQTLVHLTINGWKIDPNRISILPRSLQTLKTDISIRDQHLVHLPTTLLGLDACNAIITDAGVPYFPRWLESLSLAYIPGLTFGNTYNPLANSRISDDGLPYLPQTLKTLKLGTSFVTSLGLSKLPPPLSTLSLNWHTQQDSTLEYFKLLPRSITGLYVCNLKLSDNVIKALPRLRYIEYDRFTIVLNTSVEILVAFLEHLDYNSRERILETMRSSPQAGHLHYILRTLPWK
jgi:hypothetical protein